MKVSHWVLVMLCLTPTLLPAQCPELDADPGLRCRKQFYAGLDEGIRKSMIGLQSFNSQFEVTYRSPPVDTSEMHLTSLPDPAHHRYYEPFLRLFEYEAEVKPSQPEGRMAYESWLRFRSEAESHASFFPDGRADGANPFLVRAAVRRRDYLNHFRFRITAAAGAPIEIHFRGTSDTLDVPGATMAYRFIKEKVFTNLYGTDGAEEFHLDETVLLLGPWKTEIGNSELYPGYQCFKAWPVNPPDLRCCVRVRLQCHPSLADRVLNKTDFTPLWSFLRSKS